MKVETLKLTNHEERIHATGKLWFLHSL